MTQQIGSAYRKNRRLSWLLVAAAMVAIAAIAIPIASGAPDKNYTLAYAVATQSAPSPSLTRTPLCTSTAGQQVTLYLTNTAKSASLGSAEIAFPAYATGAIAFKKVTPTSAEAAVTGSNLAYNPTTDKLMLQSLGLGKYGSVRVVVNVNPASPTSNTITAVVKQSNQFNDSSGTANLFSDPAFPTLTVQDCFGTISGKVWNDQNENKARDAFEDLQSDWAVTLLKKTNGSYGPSGLTPTFDADGIYTFAQVPLGSDYVVCERATGPDGTKKWSQTTPTNYTGCPAAGEENGWEIAPFNETVTGKDFGNVEIASLTCGGTANSNPEFAVQVGSSTNCKTGSVTREYVYEKWTENGQQVAAFHPVAGDNACNLNGATGSCTYFVAKVTWMFGTNQQPDLAGRSLKYDDKKDSTPNAGYQYEPMLFCKKDPRTPGSEFDLESLGSPSDVRTNVLPNGFRSIDNDPQTSCLITSTESTGPDGPVQRTDYVFTAVDGRFASP